MNKQLFLKKFSRTLRWRLPKSEADEVLADYDEIFSHNFEESKDVSIQKLGEPVQAAKLLSNPKVYYRWLAVFGIMTFCLLLPEFLLLRASFYHYPSILMYILFLLGLAVSIVWFRSGHGENQKASVPKRLLPMLLSLIFITIATATIIVCLAMKVWEFIPFSLYGNIACWALQLTGTIAAAFGLFGLIKARLSDRRWRSLYVMGLTVLIECVLVLALLVSMSLDTASIYWWIPYITNFSIVGVIGLIGVGVSLC